jgi:hypothetical protein
MSKFSVRVHGKPLEDALTKLSATPGIGIVGTTEGWFVENP